MYIKYGVGCCLLSGLWAWGRLVHQVIAVAPRLFLHLGSAIFVISAYINYSNYKRVLTIDLQATHINYYH